VTVNQGTAATSAAFTVSLSAPATAPVAVTYSTADGTAQAGTDYQAVSGTLTFAPGQTQMTISVPVSPATQAEPDQTFFVNLASPAGATLTRASAGAISYVDPKSSSILQKPFEFSLTFEPITGS
jgi:hypothetical protein